MAKTATKTEQPAPTTPSVDWANVDFEAAFAPRTWDEAPEELTKKAPPVAASTYRHPWDNFDRLATLIGPGKGKWTDISLPQTYWPFYKANGGVQASKVKDENLTDTTWQKAVIRTRFKAWLKQDESGERAKHYQLTVTTRPAKDDKPAELGIFLGWID
jgi:hypothetical protein